MVRTTVKACEKETDAATAAPVVIDFFALMNGVEAMINNLLTRGRNADGYEAAKPFFDAADSLIEPLGELRQYACDLSMGTITPRRMDNLEKRYAALLDAMLLVDSMEPIDIAVRRRPVDVMSLFDAIIDAANNPANEKAAMDLRTAVYKATYKEYRDYTKRAGAVLAALDKLAPAPLSTPIEQGQEQGQNKAQEQQAAKPKPKRKPTIKQLTFL